MKIVAMDWYGKETIYNSNKEWKKAQVGYYPNFVRRATKEEIKEQGKSK